MVLSKFWWVIQHYGKGFSQCTSNRSATAAKKRRYWRWNRGNRSSSSSKRSTWKHYEGTDLNVLEKMFLNEFEHKLCYITLKAEKINGSFFLYKVGKSQPTAFKARHYTQPFKTWWEWEQNDILHQSLTWLSHGYPFEHTKVDRNYSQVLFKILNRNVKQKQPGKRSKNGLLPQQKWLCLMIWVRIDPFRGLIHSNN